MHDYRKLEVWKESMELTKMVYQLTNRFPSEEKFGLISQMRRCAVSIPSNIAEGRMRGTDKDFRRFLLTAFGSAGELDTQLQLSVDLNFLSDQDIVETNSKLESILKMLNTFISRLS